MLRRKQPCEIFGVKAKDVSDRGHSNCKDPEWDEAWSTIGSQEEDDGQCDWSVVCKGQSGMGGDLKAGQEPGFAESCMLQVHIWK